MFSDNSGALVGDRVRCPFHGACFNVRTGDIEEYPGLDCLPSYKAKHSSAFNSTALLTANLGLFPVGISVTRCYCCSGCIQNIYNFVTTDAVVTNVTSEFFLHLTGHN